LFPHPNSAVKLFAIFDSVIFIGGSRDKENVIGPGEQAPCPTCEQDRFPLLIKRTHWLQLYFLDVAPLKISYSLRCPNCGIEENVSHAEAKKIRPKASLRAAFLRGDLSEGEYFEKLNSIAE
jgi:hypothetical protein